MLALEDTPTSHFLRALPKTLAAPKAIVVVSAHWETDAPMITSGAAPETIHDFQGFPRALYDLRYPAPGDALLAARVRGLLGNAGMPAQLDGARGFDHGVWNPLLLMYPQADIAVVALSVQPGRDARWHYAMGQALAPLRAEGVLVMGTGNLTHNLREAFRGRHESVPAWVSAFAQWVADMLAQGNVPALLDWEKQAATALRNHPTPEHFLPFFVALGAGGLPAVRLHEETAMGVLAMDAYAFG